MAEPDVGADAPLSPQLFDGGVHVKGVPGDDSVRDEVQAEDLVGLLISLTALDLALLRRGPAQYPSLTSDCKRRP